MDLFRMGATYQVVGPNVTMVGRLVAVQRDDGGQPTGLWLEDEVAEKLARTLVVLGPDSQVRELSGPEQRTGAMPAGYPVAEGRAGATAEELVAEATAARGEGPAGPTPERIHPEPEDDDG